MFEFLFGQKSANKPVVENSTMFHDNPRLPVIERKDFVDEDYEYGTPAPATVSNTGKPIDRIYGFIAKNFEKEGYDDAIVNRGKEYRDQRIKMIRIEFQNLFQSVRLEYKDRIFQLEDEIQNAEDLLVISTVRKLKTLKATLLEHQSLLDEMEKQLSDDDPRMTLMIQTYERGFAKGVMVGSEKFVNL